jgi:hypothetical protein
VPLEPAVAQRAAEVEALALNGAEPTVDVRDGDLLVLAQADGPNRVRRDLVGARDRDEVGHAAMLSAERGEQALQRGCVELAAVQEQSEVRLHGRTVFSAAR